MRKPRPKDAAGSRESIAFAKISLAETLEDLWNRQLSARFDLRIGVDEWQPKLCSKPLSDRGFSGSHHADKHDGAPGKRRRRVSGVDRLALTHKPVNLASKRLGLIQDAGGECESDGALTSDRQPSCAAALFLQPYRHTTASP